MKKKTNKLYKAIDLLADLYNLSSERLTTGPVQQHTVYQTLERIGYAWNGVAWSLKERPWMLPYRKRVEAAHTTVVHTEEAAEPATTNEGETD